MSLLLLLHYYYRFHSFSFVFSLHHGGVSQSRLLLLSLGHLRGLILHFSGSRQTAVHLRQAGLHRHRRQTAGSGGIPPALPILIWERRCPGATTGVLPFFPFENFQPKMRIEFQQSTKSVNSVNVLLLSPRKDGWDRFKTWYPDHLPPQKKPALLAFFLVAILCLARSCAFERHGFFIQHSWICITHLTVLPWLGPKFHLLTKEEWRRSWCRILKGSHASWIHISILFMYHNLLNYWYISSN